MTRHDLTRHLGYRGRALLLVGTVWFFVGLNLITKDNFDPTRSLPMVPLPAVWAGDS